MQYETYSEQLFLTQVFEQHWLPRVHALPEVSQARLSGTHLPLVHLPPQHWLSAVPAAWSVVQAAVAHFPLWQCKLQQSVPVLQVSFVAPHTPTTDAQVWLFVSHTPEQQSKPPTQISLNVLHDEPAPPAPPL